MQSLVIYIISFIVVVVLYKIGLIMKKSNKNIFYKIFKIISLLVLAFIVCLRYNVGTDYFSYMNLYEYCGTVPLNEIFNYRMEPGAILVYKLSYMLSSNPITIIFSMSTIIVISLYMLMDKIEKYYGEKLDTSIALLCFLFLFLPFCFNGMRQGIAFIIGLISILEFIHNKKIASIVTILIAMSFHTSAIIIAIYMALYAFFKKNNKKIVFKTVAFSSIIAIILFAAPTILLNFSIFEKFNMYLTSNSSTINKSYVILLILNMPLLILIILNRKKIVGEEKYLAGLWISSQILYFFCSFSTFLNRISLYFEVICIILIPIVINDQTNKKNNIIIKYLCVAYMIFYFYIHFYAFGSHGIFPYQNYLFV